jgi:RNA polymerase sigma-70 factor (ECF subfamily)
MATKDKEHLWAEAMRAERRGNSAAYETLLREIAELLRRLIKHRLAQSGLGADHAEDLVQEVLISLHTKRHTWESDRLFLPWLYAITRYKLIDAARSRKREALYRIDLSFEEMSEIIDASANSRDDTMVNMERHLSNLPRSQQAVVRSLAIEGATVRATAKLLNTSEGVVRMTFHRALRQLTALAEPAIGDA